MSNKMKIGWIGLGKMGTPMSKNLIKAGYPVTVFDIVKEQYNSLSEAAGFAESPAALAEQSDLVISTITDDSALREITMGTEGVFQKAKPGSIFIDMSTVSPITSGEVGEAAGRKEVLYLRAPVSGSTLFAEAAKLTILVSGPQLAFDKCHELFNVLGAKIFYLGSEEEARYLKLSINMMVATTSLMIGEALTFGELGGMDWNQMIDVINNSAVAAPQVNFKAQVLKDRDFTPAFTVAQMAKDMDIALDTGKTVNAPMPVTNIVRQYLGIMMAQGKKDMDFFGLVTLLEQMAGIEH